MIMIIRFCSVCAVPLPLRAADSFLNRDVVSYMAVGIDLNYFFSWPLVLFIFATRLQGLKTQRHPTWFFTKRGLRYVGGYLLITNCDLSTTCLTPRVWHVTLSDGQSKQTQRPIQANPTTNPRMANGQSKVANPTTANPTTAHPRASVRGKILCTDSLSSHHSSA